jgi:hypothetical protein
MIEKVVITSKARDLLFAVGGKALCLKTAGFAISTILAKKMIVPSRRQPIAALVMTISGGERVR